MTKLQEASWDSSNFCWILPPNVGIFSLASLSSSSCIFSFLGSYPYPSVSLLIKRNAKTKFTIRIFPHLQALPESLYPVPECNTIKSSPALQACLTWPLKSSHLFFAHLSPPLGLATRYVPHLLPVPAACHISKTPHHWMEGFRATDLSKAMKNQMDWIWNYEIWKRNCEMKWNVLQWYERMKCSESEVKKWKSCIAVKLQCIAKVLQVLHWNVLQCHGCSETVAFCMKNAVNFMSPSFIFVSCLFVEDYLTREKNWIPATYWWPELSH